MINLLCLTFFLGLRLITNRLTLAGSCNSQLELRLLPASEVKVGFAVLPIPEAAIAHVITIVNDMFCRLSHHCVPTRTNAWEHSRIILIWHIKPLSGVMVVSDRWQILGVDVRNPAF